MRSPRAGGRETVSIPNLGETTGVPELAGVSLGPVTGTTSGVLGGGQVGCDYQFASNWVIGLEGDGEAANIKGDVTASFVNPANSETVTGTAHAQTFQSGGRYQISPSGWFP